MAVGQDQITLIHKAITALDGTPGDTSTLGSDVASALQSLVNLVNGNGSGTPLSYDPAVGYTPALGVELLQRIQALKSSSAYSGLENANNIGDFAVRGLLRTQSGVPNAMLNDPQLLFDLVEGAPQVIAALDAAHADNALTLSVAAAAPAPAAPAAPAAGGANGPLIPGGLATGVFPASAGQGAMGGATVMPVVSSGATPPPASPPAPPPITTPEAIYLVEQALMALAPQLNEQTEGLASKFNGQTVQLPDFVPAGLQRFVQDALGSDFVQSLISGFIPNQHIPEIAKADNIFDVRSQAALQGLMIVLSHPQVMNIQGENPWLYTPAKGQQMIANLPALKQKLQMFMSPQEFAKIDAQLKPETIAALVEALDHLHGAGLIAQEQLITPDGKPVEIPPYVKQMFENRFVMPKEPAFVQSLADRGALSASGLMATNPDMLGLLDSITRAYTGQGGILEIMPDLADVAPNFMGNVDGTLTPQARLEQFYRDALATHLRNGGTQETFATDLYVLINTTLALPYGSQAYQDSFAEMMEKAVQEALAAPSADVGAQRFGDAVMQGAQALHGEHGKPNFDLFPENQEPTWAPGLANLTVTSGGQTFTAADIAKAYDDWNFMQADPENRAKGKSDPAYRQTFIAFEDDDGGRYVAILDAQSMVFTVERVDVDKLREIYFNGSGTRAEKLDQMRAIDPAFALLVDEKHELKMGAGSYTQLLDDLASDRVKPLHQLAAETTQVAQTLRVENTTRLAEEAAKPTQLALSGSAPHAHERPITADVSYPPGVSHGSLVDLRNFVISSQMTAAPVVVDAAALALLKQHAGSGLQIGTFPGVQNLRIAGVNILGSGSGPQVAYYDSKTAHINVIDAPDRETIAKLKAITANGQPDSAAFMDEVRTRYPALFDMAESYKTMGRTDTSRLKVEALGLDDYWGFKADLRRVLLKLEGDLENAPRSSFARVARGTTAPEPAADTGFRATAADITGTERPEGPGGDGRGHEHDRPDYSRDLT